MFGGADLSGWEDRIRGVFSAEGNCAILPRRLKSKHLRVPLKRWRLSIYSSVAGATRSSKLLLPFYFLKHPSLADCMGNSGRQPELNHGAFLHYGEVLANHVPLFP